MSGEQAAQLVEAIAYALDKRRGELERELQETKSSLNYNQGRNSEYYTKWSELRNWLQESHPNIYKKFENRGGH